MASFKRYQQWQFWKSRFSSHRVYECKLYIHIPKTAGTSFRESIVDAFGKHRVIRDYGEKAGETSKAVQALIYASGDPVRILDIVENRNARMVTGHQPVNKYGGILGVTNAITILREPVSRVVSHYRHAVRHGDYKHDLLAFARSRQNQNIQKFMLGRLDPAMIGIIGITEQYGDTIDLVNSRWGWSIKNIRKNVGDKLSAFKVNVSEDERREVLACNWLDSGLYERALHVFANSRTCLEKKIGFEPRGQFTLLDKDRGVGGWSFLMGSDREAVVDLCVNGERKCSTRCIDFSAALAAWKVPRCGHVNFFEPNLKISEGDRVDMYDTEHGLLLDSQIVRLKSH